VLAIVLTPSANADLLEIWEFIAADNPGQADAFIDLIDATFRSRPVDAHTPAGFLAPLRASRATSCSISCARWIASGS